MYSLAPRQVPAGCTARKIAKGDAGHRSSDLTQRGASRGLSLRAPGGVRRDAASGSDHVVPATLSSPSSRLSQGACTLLPLASGSRRRVPSRPHGAWRAGPSNTWTGSSRGFLP